MKKEIISAITALTTAFSGMTMTAAAEDTAVNTADTETTTCETTAFQLIKGLPWYYNNITGELSNYSEVVYNYYLYWVKSIDEYYNAEHNVYSEKADSLIKEAETYVIPKESLGIENMWRVDFPTGLTKFYTEEKIRDLLSLYVDLGCLTDKRDENGFVPQDMRLQLFEEIKEYILSELDGKYVVEYDTHQGYGSPRLDYTYSGTEDINGWINISLKSADSAENYETAREITQKLVDKYGFEAVSSELWLDCHGVKNFSFDSVDFESNGFAAVDPQKIERANYNTSAPFTKIDVTRGFAYFDVAGFAENLDLQPISENNLILSENVQIAEDSPVSVSLLGDVNLDGRVSISDSVAIIQYLANSEKYPLSPQAKANADIYNTGDGITGGDASYIQQLESTKS